jgi:signal transduction histidine kinase
VELIRRRWPDLAVLILAGWVLASAVVASDPTVRVGLLVMTLALLTLLGRRRVGLISIVVCFGAMAVAMHLVPNAPASMFLGTLAGFAAAGGTATRREAAIGWAVGTAVVLVTLLNSPTTDGASDIVLTLAFCTTVWAAALVATERGRQVLSARRRVALVESTRDADVSAAAGRERARIAGELHDIVSHGLSIVVLQTVAARNTLADETVAHDPAVDRRLDAVESTARAALDDMRRLLDLLGPDDTESSSLEPSAGLAQLPMLLARARSAGQPVDDRVILDGPDLPAGLDLTAYRIVQEGLTNALKHARGAATRLDLIRTTESVTIVIRTGPGPGAAATPNAGSGFGLIGMRERVRVYDGSLVAERDGDDFVVRAVLPLCRAIVEEPA